MEQNEKIAAIGPRQQLPPLKSIGVRTCEIEPGRWDEAKQALDELAQEEGLSLILINESLAEGIGREAVAEVRENTGTIVMAIPSHEGSTGLTEKWFKYAMEHSIGVDLISD